MLTIVYVSLTMARPDRDIRSPDRLLMVYCPARQSTQNVEAVQLLAGDTTIASNHEVRTPIRIIFGSVQSVNTMQLPQVPRERGASSLRTQANS